MLHFLSGLKHPYRIWPVTICVVCRSRDQLDWWKKEQHMKQAKLFALSAAAFAVSSGVFLSSGNRLAAGGMAAAALLQLAAAFLMRRRAGMSSHG
jgi:hypothetical protein